VVPDSTGCSASLVRSHGINRITSLSNHVLGIFSITQCTASLLVEFIWNYEELVLVSLDFSRNGFVSVISLDFHCGKLLCGRPSFHCLICLPRGGDRV
jgi:hypothetical protein